MCIYWPLICLFLWNIYSWVLHITLLILSISALLTMLKPLTVRITTNWKILKEMGIPHHLTCLLGNLYAGQEATVRTGHETTDWFQIRKGVCQGCILSPCLFNFCAEYIMRNSGLDEAQAGIKITGRNITSDMQMTPPVWQKVKKNQRASWWKWKESEKVGLKLNIQKTKIMAPGPITSLQIERGTIEAVRDFIFWGSKITADSECSHEIKIHSSEEKLWPT